MDKFESAIQTVLAHEGYYSYNKKDSGGPTKYGISLRYLKLEGIDIDQDGDVDIQDVKKLSISDARLIYKRNWWDKYGYDRIESELVATKVFDLSVNMGSKMAHKIIQRSVCVLSKDPDFLEIDGILGRQTIAAVNKAPGGFLLIAIRAEAGAFYRSLKQDTFIKGWLRRAYS